MLSECEYAEEVNSMKEMTFFHENSYWGQKASSVDSCRTRSGFRGSKSTLIGLWDVSENQTWQCLAVRECVTAHTVSGRGGGGTKSSRAHVILFNQLVTCCSSEPAVGRNVPTMVSSCEVPGMHLCTISHLTPPPAWFKWVRDEQQPRSCPCPCPHSCCELKWSIGSVLQPKHNT